MTNITAVATLTSKTDPSEGQVALAFHADYSDPRNKEWAKYTPALSLNMTVLESVAASFDQGQRYLLTFQPAD